MAEILITLPLSMFEGDEPLTPGGIRTMLTEAVELKERNLQLEGKIEGLKNVVRSFGLSLAWTLDNSENEMAKARNLRDLAESMKNYG